MSGTYLQLFISHNMGCQYYLGSYDTQRDLFVPETHGRMSWADSTFFAPEALIDDRGRQIMWAWLKDDPFSGTDQEERHRQAIADGWAGVYGLPRVLWLGEDDTLRMAPAPELQTLRYNEKRFDDIGLDDGREFELEGIDGRSCEISVTIDLTTAHRVGLKVRTSANNEETTLLYYGRSRAETGIRFHGERTAGENGRSATTRERRGSALRGSSGRASQATGIHR